MTTPIEQMISTINTNGVDKPTNKPAYAAFTSYLVSATEMLGPRFARTTYYPIISQTTRSVYLLLAAIVFIIMAVIVFLLLAANLVKWYFAIGILAIVLTVIMIYAGAISAYENAETYREATILGTQLGNTVTYTISSLFRDGLYSALYR